MGNMYANVTVRGAASSAVEQVLRRSNRSAYLLTTPEGLVIFDELSDRQDGSVESLARDLSAECRCVALAVTNHDDDVLMYRLFADGTERDSYNSAPGYFDWDGEGEEPGPEGGDAQTVANVYQRIGHEGEITDALEGEYDFELDRHMALCRALQLPTAAVSNGFQDLSSSRLKAEELGGSALLRIG